MTPYKAKLEVFQENLWGHFLPIPKKIVYDICPDKSKRIICHFEGLKPQSKAFLHSPEHGWYILVNKETRKHFNIDIGDSLSVQFEKDESKYGMEMPLVLDLFLQDDLEGSKYFEALTPGKKRSLIYLVANAKREETQIKKSMAILHHLKEVNGALDFKQLNETFKEFNKNKNLKINL